MAETTTSDPVSRLLLPVLVHEVNNATQLLVGLRALLDLPGGEALFAQRADELARTSLRMEELGFALAVLATSNGSNMLLARRHPRAVELLWDLTVHAIERRDEVRVSKTGTPPEIASGALDGWQAPWSIAAVLVHAAEIAPIDGWRWRWEDDGTLVGRAPSGTTIDERVLMDIAERAPGERIDVADGAITVRFPSEWIA